MSKTIKAAFNVAIKDGKGVDETKVEMIKAGCSFKDAGRLYKDWAVESGIIIDPKERANRVGNILVGMDSLDTEDGFDTAVERIIDYIDGTSIRQAGALIRAWGKRTENPIYKRVRKAGKGRNGINIKIFALLRANPLTTEKEMDAFVDENGSVTSKKTWRSHYQKIRILVNAIALGDTHVR